MYGQQPRHHRGGNGRGAPPFPAAQPLAPDLNPNLFPQYFYHQNLNPFATNQYFPNPNFPLHTPTFPIQQFPNFFPNQNNFPIQPRPSNRPDVPIESAVPKARPNNKPHVPIERIDSAAAEAHRELLAKRESVSAWKVSQAVLLILKAESWESLGVQMQLVPSLHRLIIIEGKISAFIHCFVAVQRITSLYDLEVAICKNEGVERFEELELGPLVRHPLVMHYFSVSTDLTEVFKITSEEVISCLCEFMIIQKGKEIKVEEFLDFIAKKRSVTCSEKLSVRIQSLGMHATLIRQARRSESTAVNKIFDDLQKKSEKKSCKRRPLLSLQKKQLDDHFSSITQRVNSFPPLRENIVGKHIKFSSSSEDDGSCDSEHEGNKNDADAKNNSNLLSHNTSSSDRVSNCPYPSASEEMSRLGLKGDMDVSASAACGSERYNRSTGDLEKKRKSGNLGSNITAPHKLHKKDKTGSDFSIDEDKKEFIGQHEANLLLEADLSLPSSSMKMFITTWKEACRENTVGEVFERMLQFYKTTGQTRIKGKGMFRDVGTRKRMMSMFSSYPCIGLLNVAVTSIKCGMWDSVYDAFQTFTEQGAANTISNKCAEYESIEIEPAERVALVVDEHVSKCVTVEDIVKKVSIYFDLDFNDSRNVKSSLENKFTLLRKLRECEFWLTKEFSVEEFESLGYGEFFAFLEKHVSLMPNTLQMCLTDYAYGKSPLEVCMLQHQLAVLLSQASNSLGGIEYVTKEMISVLLMRQFPQISFTLVESGSLNDFSNLVRENVSTSTCVVFSATLLGNRSGDSVNEKALSKTTAEGPEIGPKTGNHGSFTTKDAIEVLLRAPMLADLELWTHWDLRFAPSLGPLVGWLLNKVNTKELLCLVTKDGKVFRVDHTSTVDSFLEASLQGSSFQTVVKLLSLLSLYGGERHVPLPLLKCYARQAFEVLTKNFMEVKENQTFLTHGNSLYRLHKPDEDATGPNTDLRRSNSTVHDAATDAASFFIDCLGHFPTEFRTFAADILLSGLQSVIKDAPLAILGKCKQIEQRLMLHDVGLSLGIVEWIDDYHVFGSNMAAKSFPSSGVSCLQAVSSEFIRQSTGIEDAVNMCASTQGDVVVSTEMDQKNEECNVVCYGVNNEKTTGDCFSDERHLSVADKENKAALIIESIRREEFGLDPSLSQDESRMLKKQHARLGRALHCLSQELYSQDSHFLLELVQNADDNVYPPNVEPTLSFILQDSGIVVLNNEQGFSEQNIRALCDVGNSTKKGSSSGYIGKKGIGFKSVFRVTDAPEIHSNGFHVKFDITEGQIGFVVPTVLPPCDIKLFQRLACCDLDNMDTNCWNTCIVLPFRTNVLEGSPMNSFKPMFLDLHPSLLLFLHRLHCIRFRDMVSDSFIIMRKQNLGNGIVKVSVGKETMTWFVESQELKADTIRPDVKTTEISVAFTLQESDNEGFIPCLDQQPVFAFLPLRRYGLKFIIQGDFVLPSSREEVDGDSPWNQWLLSKVPDLFIGAERSFCALPCFSKNPGKAVAAFMSFVPLVGEVHGFFSSLPRLIISKLRTSKCLLMEGDKHEWVLPCKVIRRWNQQARSLLPDSLLNEHLGLGFLDKNIVLSDSLARDLGVQEYGPKVLLQVISSLCNSENGLKSVSLVWLSSWLDTLYTMVLNSSGLTSIDSGAASDAINTLKKIPFIPLSDGTYSSVDDGTIWLHSDGVSPRLDDDHGPDVFPLLYAELRTVSPALLSAAATVDVSCLDVSVMGNIIRMLQRVGVQQVSAHEIVMVHILPAISDDKIAVDKKRLMIEYLSFVLLHLQSSCPNCHVERGQIISELRNKAFIFTNHGYKRSGEVSIHFSVEFGNPIDVHKLISGLDLKWHEVDVAYSKHPMTGSLPGGILKWRDFFQEIGITDFVHVVPVEKKITDIPRTVLKNISWNGDLIYHGAIAKDWESPELFHLLSQLSSSGDQIRCKFLLEVLDTLWDDYYNDKATGQLILNSSEDIRIFQSSFMSSLCDVRWMVSSMDNELHYSKELFHDSDAIRSILGAIAPYAVPKVKSEKLLSHVGFRTEVSLDDIFVVLQVWRSRKSPFLASIAQMTKFYTFIWNEMATSKQKIVDELRRGPFIFVPYSVVQRHEDVVPGVFYSPSEVYWHDLTGSINQVKEIHPHSGSNAIGHPLCKTLCNVYPSLQEFFVSECAVNEEPHLRSYLEILLQLSTVALPSQAANMVFRVFLQWSNGLKSGILSHEDLSYLKECLLKLEFAVLPTVLDKWVSLHPSFGLICWCDDENLKKEFKHFDNIDFLYFGELSDDEQDMFRVKVSVLLQNLGIPALSEVITREAIHYGLADHSLKADMLNWALPYAQRYIYNAHHDRYSQLKQTGFEKLCHLQIVVVEKLFYRNVLTRSGIASKKRSECSCLLLGNIFYATRDSDSHALFMEFSRLLFEGTPNLHLANFLHMITTMVESGSNEEQIEFFILNSQKVPKLPDDESVWSLSSVVPSSTINKEAHTVSTVPSVVPSSTINKEAHTVSTVIPEQQNPTKSKRKGNWPPADWRTAPGFSFPRLSRYRAEEALPPPTSSVDVMEDDSKEKIGQMDHITHIEFSSDWTVEGVAYNPVPSEASENKPVASLLGSANDSIDLVTPSDDLNLMVHKNTERDQFSFGTPNAEAAMLTGRLGELVAFNYFTMNFGAECVTWVNKDNETGLPYDIVIGEEGKGSEYIEVKATRSLKKDWFFISSREWQFAFEQGESFSIVHVGLSDSNNNRARITVFKNPVRLCHQGKLQLAVVMPKQLQEFSTVS